MTERNLWLKSYNDVCDILVEFRSYDLVETDLMAAFDIADASDDGVGFVGLAGIGTVCCFMTGDEELNGYRFVPVYDGELVK